MSEIVVFVLIASIIYVKLLVQLSFSIVINRFFSHFNKKKFSF